MSLRPRDAPFTFEPHEPTPSEIYPGLSGSEDELDEATRASKRRRIEQRAQEYLDGKPLYILSASLKGPFDKNWANPWKRTKPHTAKPTPNTRILNQGSAGKETKHARDEPLSATTVRRLREESSGLRPSGSSDQLTKTGKNAQGVSRRKSSTQFDNDRTTIPPSSIPRSSAKKQDQSPALSTKSYSTASKEGWLKRRPKDQLRVEPLKSPSPTPIARQKRVSDTQTDDRNTSPVPLETSGFTPVNRQKYTHPNDLTKPTTFPPESASSAKDGSINSLQGRTNRKKGPTSRKSNSSRNGSSRGQIPRRSMIKPSHETVVAGNNSLKHVAPRDADHFEFEYSRPNPYFDACTNSKQLVPEKDTGFNRTIDLRESGVSSHDFAYGNQKRAPEESSPAIASVPAGEPKCVRRRNIQDPEDNSNENSSLAPKTFDTDGETTETMMSHNITSAQLPPEYAKISAEVLSLQSTCFVELKSNTIDTNLTEENNENQISTQAAVSSAQKSFQDALMTPDKDPQTGAHTTIVKHSSKSVGSGEKRAHPGHKITPFGAVRSPAKNTHCGTIDNDDSINPPPINTQALFDAVSPFAVSTEKKVRDKVSFSCEEEIDTPTRRNQEVTAPPPVLDTAPPGSPFEVAGFDFGSDSNESTSQQENQPEPAKTPTDPALVDTTGAPGEPSLPPTASGVPPISTTSTSPQQDGQLVEDRDNFNLNQAIADAGTFLQSWDIEKDLRSCSGNVHSPASVPERQPVPSES